MRFFFSVDRVGMQLKDCIVCTPVLLWSAGQYIVHMTRGRTVFLCWVDGFRLHVY